MPFGFGRKPPYDPAQVVAHEEPVWRSQTNYILMADLGDFDFPGRYEQLWLTKLGDNRFRLCCLPFFTYGYSLGDVIETKTKGGRQVLGRVVERSGRGLVRLVLHAHGPDHEAIHGAIATCGLLSEWRGDGYVAVDLPDGIPDQLQGVMTRLGVAGDFHWEHAGSRDIP